MKIKTQTESVLTIKEGNLPTIIFGLLFFIAGVWTGYTVLNSSNNNNFAVGLIVAVIFIATGLAITFFSYAIVVDFDKTSGQVIYQEKGLIRSKKVAYSISDIIRVETRNGWKTETSTRKNGFSSSRQIPIAQSFLIFKDGLILAIDRENTPPSGILVSGLNANTERTIANSIATFIGVPFQAISPTVAETPIITGLGGGIQL